MVSGVLELDMTRKPSAPQRPDFAADAERLRRIA